MERFKEGWSVNFFCCLFYYFYFIIIIIIINIIIIVVIIIMIIIIIIYNLTGRYTMSRLLAVLAQTSSVGDF